jgi:hypothetical protein
MITLTPHETVELCRFIERHRDRLNAGENLTLTKVETTDGDAVFASIGGTMVPHSYSGVHCNITLG